MGALMDAVHAVSMAAWILGLPLLFWRRWPRLSLAYSLYAVVFVVANRVSYYVLGECFLTTLARRLWTAGAMDAGTEDWFTVRFAKLVFGLTPSHRAIALASEALIFVTALGVLISLRSRTRELRREQRIAPGERQDVVDSDAAPDREA